MNMKTHQAQIQRDWTTRIRGKLVGRQIVEVRYMTREEADAADWLYRPLVMFLDDGTFLYPMMDDEGNDGGAIATSLDDLPAIPVMR